MNKIIVTLVLLAVCLTGYAQYEGPESYTYPKTATGERKVIPYRYVREANVKWSKRLERVIDVREKQNLIMHWPRNPFYKMLHDNVLNGKLKPYMSDSLSRYYDTEQVLNLGGRTINVKIPDPLYPDDRDMDRDSEIVVKFDISQVKKYRIMEDWIFDHNYSDFRARIIAIAPIYKPYFAGMELAEQPMYWIKMDDLRPIIVNQELFNYSNDAARLSFDDFFQMRMFNSYIVKESNVYDQDINMFEEFKDDGIAALLESDKIKNDLFIFEHDLWQY